MKKCSSPSHRPAHSLNVTFRSFADRTELPQGCQQLLCCSWSRDRFDPTSGTCFHEDLVMENISTAILPLSLIQEEQLSVNGERKNTKYWLTASERLAKEECG